MLKTKKILSLALVVLMFLSTVVIGAYAVPAEGTDFGIALIADKTESEIVPGAKVTVTLHYDVTDKSQQLGDMKLALLYDNSIYTADADSREFVGDLAKYADSTVEAKINSNFGKAVKTAATSMTNEEKAKYNDAVMLTIARDPEKQSDENKGFTLTMGENGLSIAECKIVFTVTGDAAAVANGNKNISLCNTINKRTQYCRVIGNDGPLMANAIDVSRGNIMANMPAAPAGPVVSKAKSQVKMTATSDTTVADEFSFRVISKISDSDWDTYFKNTGKAGATTDYITAVGMVAYKGAAAFDAETAKKVVAGTPAEDYTAATTNYISKVNDTADAEFGAIIKANHSTLKNDVTYMGFVQYVDASGNAQTIFYETAGTAALSTNYDNIVSKYLAAYPFAA